MWTDGDGPKGRARLNRVVIGQGYAREAARGVQVPGNRPRERSARPTDIRGTDEIPRVCSAKPRLATCVYDSGTDYDALL